MIDTVTVVTTTAVTTDPTLVAAVVFALFSISFAILAVNRTLKDQGKRK